MPRPLVGGVAQTDDDAVVVDTAAVAAAVTAVGRTEQKSGQSILSAN
jgi:hypothetical protein